jgi:hypothetical protein
MMNSDDEYPELSLKIENEQLRTRLSALESYARERMTWVREEREACAAAADRYAAWAKRLHAENVDVVRASLATEAAILAAETIAARIRAR